VCDSYEVGTGEAEFLISRTHTPDAPVEVGPFAQSLGKAAAAVRAAAGNAETTLRTYLLKDARALARMQQAGEAALNGDQDTRETVDAAHAQELAAHKVDAACRLLRARLTTKAGN